MWRDTDTRYGRVSRVLHWLLFILIAVQFLLALSFGRWPSSAANHVAMVTHQSLGLLILGLGLVFIVWRLTSPKPTLASLALWQRALAHLVHTVIYVAVIAQALFGILMNFGHGYPLPFFGLFTIPVFLPIGNAAGQLFGTLHGFNGWWVLLIALGVHVLATLFHAFVRRDGVFRRMTRGEPMR